MTAGPVTTFQESTYAPDTAWRWMGSIAMDQQGDMALGYSASDATIFPQLRYTGRLATDPLNSMSQGEAHLFDGTGAQTDSFNRWGDYSDMTIDPVDDCISGIRPNTTMRLTRSTGAPASGTSSLPSAAPAARFGITATLTGSMASATNWTRSLGQDQFASVYDDFDVTDPGGWDVDLCLLR